MSNFIEHRTKVFQREKIGRIIKTSSVEQNLVQSLKKEESSHDVVSQSENLSDFSSPPNVLEEKFIPIPSTDFLSVKKANSSPVKSGKSDALSPKVSSKPSNLFQEEMSFVFLLKNSSSFY